MRIIVWHNSPEFWLAAAILLGVIVCVVVYQWLRPPAWKRLLQDGRYREALGAYDARLRQEEPTDDDLRQARDAAVEHLVKEHGVAAEEARENLRPLVAQYHRDRSYELRNEAVAHEQAGAYGLALEYYQRAARWQAAHDLKDHQFLLGCVDRVRRKARPR